MDKRTAFLSGIPLRFVQREPLASCAYSSPCCSSSRPSSRRVFLRRLLCGTATVMLSSTLSGNVFAIADPETSEATAQAKPKSRPRKVAWGYAEENGPTKWGTLSEEWTLCDTGLEQSPIALSYREAVAPADTPRPTLNTTSGKIAVRMREINPWAADKSLIIEPYIPPPPPLVGDAPPVDVYKPPPPLAVVTLPDVGSYVFQSCHFHVGGSEHVIDGHQGVMETHFIFEKSARAPQQEKPAAFSQLPTNDPVTQPASVPAAVNVVPSAAAATADESGAPQVLVVALLGTAADSSAPWLQNILENFPLQKNEAESRPSGIIMDIDVGDILPGFENTSLYAYNGSLTVPPGTEGVYWLVIGDRMDAAEKDVQALMSAQTGPNVRPLQPLNGRTVTRFPADTSPGE